MKTKLKDRAKFFPVGDFIPGIEMSKFGFRTIEERMKGQRHIMAEPTGEKRPPLKGEWFLSGAEAAAYRAPNDLSTPYHIATLVKVETRTVTTYQKA